MILLCGNITETTADNIGTVNAYPVPHSGSCCMQMTLIAEAEDDLIKRLNEWNKHTQSFYCSSGICTGLPA